MNELSSARIEKLPKWAQREIDRLKRERDDARAALAASTRRSEIYYSPTYPLGNVKVFIPEDAWVCFGSPDETHDIGVHWNTLMREMVIHGRNAITVRPQAANAVHIRLSQPERHADRIAELARRKAIGKRGARNGGSQR